MTRPSSGNLWPRSINPSALVLPGGSTGEVLAKVSGTDYDLEWATGGGGGGGGAGYPTAAPAVPNANDDEFTAASLDAAWTTVLDPIASGFVVTPDKYGSWFSLEGPGAGADQNGQWRRNIGAAGDAGVQCAITARMRLIGIGGGAAAAYLGWGDNVSLSAGNLHQGGVSFSSNDQVANHYVDGGANVAQGIGAAHGEFWSHFQRTSGNVMSWWYSRDGVGWIRRYSASRTMNLPYVWMQIVGGSASQPFEVSFDFVRVNSIWLGV